MTNNFSKLNDEEFAQLIKNAPLVSIDVIVKNPKKRILLGRRKNEPAKDKWFIPGGRVLKNETIEEAFQRIIKSELPLKDRNKANAIKVEDAIFLGVFQHRYEENKFEIKGFGTHYIVIAYEITLSQAMHLSGDEQHSSYRWFNLDKLLKNKDVHDNTKGFFTRKTFSIKPYTVPDDSGMYRALMAQYIHYDRQFWSRTQILLAIQGAAFIGGYNLRFHWLGYTIMFATFLLVIIIWALIDRDICNSRVNETQMDELSNKIFKNKSEKLVVSLRSDPRFEWVTGRRLIHTIVIILLILNIGLGFLYMKFKDKMPPATDRTLIILENRITELSSNLSANMGKLDDQLKEFNHKLKSVENKLSNKYVK